VYSIPGPPALLYTPATGWYREAVEVGYPYNKLVLLSKSVTWLGLLEEDREVVDDTSEE
jgi:hypothetical protein